MFLSHFLLRAYNKSRGVKMKISVCLIARNEEEVIGRCLESISVFADEIIVVDTGSIDKTKKIAGGFTEKIFDFEWINDFSAARNYAFSKACGDYLMWVDADDVAERKDGEKINELKKEKNPADTYMMKYYAGVDKRGNPTFEFYRERLLKNCPSAKFTGFVHECIPPFGMVKYSDIKIVHKKEKAGNPARNLDIYNYHIARGAVLNERETYYYAKEFFYLQRYDKCKEWLEKYFTMDNLYAPDEWDALLTCFCCYEKTGENGGEKYLFKALEKFGPDSRILCCLGDYYKKRLKISEAENYYKMSLLCDIKRSGFFEDRKYDFLEPCLRLVALYFECGEYLKAKDYHLLSKKRFPEDPSVIFNDKFFK